MSAFCHYRFKMILFQQSPRLFLLSILLFTAWPGIAHADCYDVVNGASYIIESTDEFSLGNQDVMLCRYVNKSSLDNWVLICGTALLDAGSCVAAAANGDVYVAGKTGALRDFFLLKYKETGARLFAKAYGWSDHDVTINDMCVAPDDSVYLCGQAQSTIDDRRLALVIKLGPTGEVKWAKRYASEYSEYQDNYKAVIADNSNVYCVSQSWHEANNLYGMTITQYAANSGSLGWADYWQSADWVWPRDLELDSSGNVYIAAGLKAKDYADPYSSAINLVDMEVLLVKYSMSGVFQWGQYYGGEHYDWPNDMAVGPDDLLVVVGYYGADLVPPSGEVVNSDVDRDPLILAWNPNGVLSIAALCPGSIDEIYENVGGVHYCAQDDEYLALHLLDTPEEQGCYLGPGTYWPVDGLSIAATVAEDEECEIWVLDLETFTESMPVTAADVRQFMYDRQLAITGMRLKQASPPAGP